MLLIYCSSLSIMAW